MALAARHEVGRAVTVVVLARVTLTLHDQVASVVPEVSLYSLLIFSFDFQFFFKILVDR